MNLAVLTEIAQTAGAGTSLLMAVAIRVLWVQLRDAQARVQKLQDQRLADVKAIYEQMVNHSEAVRASVDRFAQVVSELDDED